LSEPDREFAPVPVTAIRKDYLFSEAFELVGRRLFGSDWTGNELTAHAFPSPKELAKARAPLERKLAVADAELARIEQQIRSTLSEPEMKRLVEQRNDVMDRRVEIHHSLRANPVPTEIHAQDYETYQRGQTAEAALIAGLAQGKIKAHNGRGYSIDSWLWNGHQHFRYDVRLSIVRLPSNLSSRRHEPARIDEREFDQWCRELETLTPSAEQALSDRERCTRILGPMLSARTYAIKAHYLSAVRAVMPDLSEREFEFVWAVFAPDSLKKGGRRRRS
jgi:hypothetical protein